MALNGRLISKSPETNFLIRIAVIGFGYWGPNLARNLCIPDRARVVAICDSDPARLKVAADRYPRVRTSSSAMETIQANDIDAVAIATPAASHFALALAALRSGKHVLISKPMTQTSRQALLLVEEAQRRRLVLLVDHTFVYTSAVQHLGEMFRAGSIGELHYYESIRVNLGVFQPDVNVLWDLALHDFSILDYLLRASPLAISAIGRSHIRGLPASMAWVTLHLPDAAIAHVNVNWIAAVKLRHILIGGSKKLVIYDEQQPSEKLRIYEQAIDRVCSADEALERRTGFRTGEITVPTLESREALSVEAEHFLDCIETNAAPITGGIEALRLIELLEHADLSMQRGGQPVELASRGG